MKASVVIPAHNEEQNLAHTIRAVLAQDYPNFEVIVVNNASIDATESIARSFPVIVVNETRKGLLWAREAGRIADTGDIIINIDADCLPETDWLSRGMAHFKKDHIVAVTGPYDYHDGGFFFRNSSLITQKYIYKLMSLALQAPGIKKGAVLIGGNNFIRSHVLNKAGGYTTSILFYGEDTDTAKKIAEHGKVVFNPSLHMKTSARRFKSEGTIHLMLKYWYHFFKTIFGNKK